MRLLKKPVSLISSERGPKEVQRPLRVSQALHDTLALMHLIVNPHIWCCPKMWKVWPNGSWNEKWTPGGFVGPKMRGTEEEMGKTWKAGIKLQEKHQLHAQELILSPY